MANQKSLHPDYLEQRIKNLNNTIDSYQKAADGMSTSTIQNAWMGKISNGFHGLSAEAVEDILLVGLKAEIERLTGLRDKIYHELDGAIINSAEDHGVIV